jgi:SulP family sulfate permease
LLILASQIPVALGTTANDRNELRAAVTAIWHAGSWHTSSILLALLAVLILLTGRRIHPLFPAVLIAVSAAILVSDMTAFQGAKLGHINAGLPPVTQSLPIRQFPRLVVPALVIALLGFVEASSIARTYAAMDRKRWDANREFASQGVANIAAGLFGGFPVGASFSRSALNRFAGAKSNLSGVVTGASVLAFLPLAFVLAPLPRSVLAAIVIVAVVPLIRLDRILTIVRLSRPQAWVTLAAFSFTLLLAPHIEWAVMVAAALSIAIHLWRELRLDVSAAYQNRTLQLVPQGVLWFATARTVEDKFVGYLAAYPDATRLKIRLDGLGRIDLAGALALKTLIEDARRAGLDVTITGAPAHASRVLHRVLPGDVAEPS